MTTHERDVIKNKEAATTKRNKFMSRGINKVILVGNLGADPEVRTTQNGSTITSIKVATSEAWTDKQTGQKQERTEWHRVKFFGKLAEVAGQYLKKGSQVYVDGYIRTEKYTDKAGVERYATDIIANEMQMLGSPDSKKQQRQPIAQEQSHNNSPELDDEIPF